MVFYIPPHSLIIILQYAEKIGSEKTTRPFAGLCRADAILGCFSILCQNEANYISVRIVFARAAI